MDSNSKIDSKSHSAATWAVIRRFWRVRGGWRDLPRSLYFRLSVLLLVPTIHFWLFEAWWDLPITVLPNLLGFSLGGYAILLAFGDDRFKRLLAKRAKDEGQKIEPTILLESSAVFLHFILVQLVALFVAVVARSLAAVPNFWFVPAKIITRYLSYAGSCIGFFLFIYAMMMAGAAALSVFSLGEMFETYLASPSKENDKPGDNSGD